MLTLSVQLIKSISLNFVQPVFSSLELIMFNKILLIAALISSTTVFANNVKSNAVITEKDKVITLNIAENNWASIATNSVNGLVKIREYFDMGKAGVQHIDYVANCSNKKLSMAAFKVLPTVVTKNEVSTNVNVSDLSFYKPVLQHDTNIVEKACSPSRSIQSAQADN